MKRILHTAGLLMIKEGKLLLCFSKNKKAWYLPGGKVDLNETAKEALIREVQEELNLDLNPEHLEYVYHITAPAFGEVDIIMEQDCFIYPPHHDIQASNEIEAIRYFNPVEYAEEQHQVIGVLKAFEFLQEKKWI